MMIFRARYGFVWGALLIVAFAVAATGPALGAEEELAPFPGKKTSWKGYDRYDFEVGKFQTTVVMPKKEAPGKQWVWRAGPFGERPELDLALLEKGFFLLHSDTTGKFASLAARRHWATLYSRMTIRYDFARKVVVECYGVEGLIAATWASRNAGRVACLVGVGPLLDYKSWPGGKGKGQADKQTWQALLEAYEFKSEKEALEYDQNPVDTAKPLAEANTPIIIFAGKKDEAALLAENAALFKERYEKAGGKRFVMHELPAKSEDFEWKNVDRLVALALRETVEAEAQLAAELKKVGNWKVTRFGGEGPVRVEDGAIYLDRGQDMTGVTWDGEAPCRIDYELTLEAQRVSGGDFFCGLTFPVGKDPCSLVLGGWGGTLCGISCLDHMDAANNETSTFKEFETGRWYAVRLRVTADKLQAWIDGERIVDVEIKERKISVRWEMESSTPVGIATWQTGGAFRNLKMTPLEE